MRSIDVVLEQLDGARLTPEDVVIIERFRDLVEAHKDQGIFRVTLKMAWVFRPAFTIRLRHFLPWLRWLLSSAAAYDLPHEDTLPE